MYITGTAEGVNWLPRLSLILVDAGIAPLFLVATGLSAQKRLTGIKWK
jgi:hypothetical protein